MLWTLWIRINCIWNLMMNKKQLIVRVGVVLLLLSGCASVNYTSYVGDLKLTRKPQDMKIQIIEGNAPISYEVIGLLSITMGVPSPKSQA